MSQRSASIAAEQPLPAPWINVIANADFGTQCSAEGGGYTWFGNSREFQITPWSNDPVSDPPGEVFYVKDLSNGQVMSPCVQPKGLARGTFRTRHGFGYTIHEAEVGDVSLDPGRAWGHGAHPSTVTAAT